MKTLSRTMLLATLLLTGTVEARVIEIDVNGLVCGFCAQGITKKLKTYAATRDVVVSLEHHVVGVDLQPDQDIDDAELTRALTDAGYTVTAIRRTDATLDDLRARLREKHE